MGFAGELAQQGGKFAIEQAGKALKKLTPKAAKKIGNIGLEEVGGVKMPPQHMDFLRNHNTLHPEDIGNVNRLFEGTKGPDSEDAYEGLNDFLHTGMFGKAESDKAASNALANPVNKSIDPNSLEFNKALDDFTVDPSMRSQELEELGPEDINWRFEAVEKNWADIESKLAKGEAKAAAAGKEFKPSGDLVSQMSSLGPVDPTQVKGWVKTAMAKFKSGLLRERGGTYLDAKGVPRPEIEGMTYLELHHELMKQLYASYMMQVKSLYQAGSISKKDVLNFNFLAKQQGFGLGDYGVKGYNRPAHSLGHQRAIQMMIQPSGEELTQRSATIKQYTDINDLTEDFLKSLNEVAVPMRRELDLSQRAYNAMAPWDQEKVIRLYNKKDKLKLDLLERAKAFYNENGLKIPKKVNGEGLLDRLNKKGIEPTSSLVELRGRVEAARSEAESFLKKIKEATSEQIEKDIARDIDVGRARDRPGKGVARSGDPTEARLEEESFLRDEGDDRFGTEEFSPD